MSLDIAYSPPFRTDICIAYCYYNPSGDPVVLKNAQDLENKLKAASIPYFNAELVFPGTTPVLENPTLSLSCKSPLFYKESAWNLLEKKIPSNFTKICFMEVNLKHTRADWLDCLSLMLNFYDVVQPFSEVQYVDESGSVIKSDVGAVKSGSPENVQGNMWGMTRNFFEKNGGFFDKTVVCSNLLYPALTAHEMPLNLPLIDADYKAYAAKVAAAGSNIRYLNCSVFSVPNGHMNDMSDLMASLKSKSSDWNSMFSLNSSGLWELNDPDLASSFKALYSLGSKAPVAASAVKPINTPVVPAVQAPVVAPVVAPVIAPVVKAVFAPVVAPVVNAMVAPVPQPPVVAPVPQPPVAPVVAPVVKPVVSRAVAPMVAPVPQPPVVVPVPQPPVAPVAKPVAQPPVAPVAKPEPQPPVAPVPQAPVAPMVAPMAKPVVQAPVAPVAKPVAHPPVAPMARPVVQAPMVAPVARPVAKPVVQAAVVAPMVRPNMPGAPPANRNEAARAAAAALVASFKRK